MQYMSKLLRKENLGLCMQTYYNTLYIYHPLSFLLVQMPIDGKKKNNSRLDTFNLYLTSSKVEFCLKVYESNEFLYN